MVVVRLRRSISGVMAMSSSLSQRRMAGSRTATSRSRARRESASRPRGRRDLVLQNVAQEVEVEALHDLEDGKFPIEVDSQR